MTALPADASMWAVVLAGGLIAGFITGFAGFGTGLVASGFWLQALPAGMAPPLVALASVAGQVVGLFAVRAAFEWRRATPYLAGGVLGVPIGVAALAVASPAALRLTVGGFLILYAACQLSGLGRLAVRTWGGKAADGAIGLGGGFLGGFSGLSGPLPLVWLQLRGGPSAGQRAVYQPFNLVVLTLASIGMAASGRIDRNVLVVALAVVPTTPVGAWAGARLYGRASEAAFRRIVLGLLLASGGFLLLDTLFG